MTDENCSASAQPDGLRTYTIIFIFFPLVLLVDTTINSRNAQAIDGVQSPTIEVVALSEHSVTASATDVPSLFFDPIINNAGNIVFEAYLRRGGSNDNAVIAGNAGDFRVVAREGQAIGGAGEGNFGTFDFTIPALSDSGTIAFAGRITHPSRNSEGIWLATVVGGPQLVARKFDHAPGLAPNIAFSDFRDAHLALSTTDKLLMFVDVGPLSSSGSIHTSNDGYWVYDNTETLSILGSRGLVAPGNAPKQFTQIDATMNSGGDIVLTGNAAAGGQTVSGIWRGSNYESLVLEVARTDMHVANGTIAQFSMLDPLSKPVLNLDGKLAFRAEVRIATSGDVTRYRGLWTLDSDLLLQPLALENGQPPGTPAGSFFTSPHPEYSMNEQGLVSFRNTLAIAGAPFQTVGLWSQQADGSVRLLATSGMQVPGAPAGVKFGGRLESCCFGLAFDVPVINDKGQTAFLAALEGPAVRSGDERAILAQDLNGTLRLIAREGDFLEIAPGDIRQIDQLQFVGGGNQTLTRNQQQTLNTGFNDRGQLIFSAVFKDGSSAVLVSNLVAVPEPPALLMLMSCLPAMVRLKRSRADRQTFLAG